jgi:hypothetical protein
MLRIVAIALLSFAAALITAAQEKTDASADKSMILALESPSNQGGNSPRRQRGNDHHRRYLYQHRSSWSHSESIAGSGWAQGSLIQTRRNRSTPIPFTSTETSPSLPASIPKFQMSSNSILLIR